MRVEQERGKLSPARLRLYHSMYQMFTFTMLLALLTNNVGILWVAMEAATLTTVLLVSLYRTPPASRRPGSTSSCAAWASRRRCSAPFCCTWPRRRCWARAAPRCCGLI